MGLFDELFDPEGLFDFDGDGKTGLLDAFIANEWFEIFNEYCDLKEKQNDILNGKYNGSDKHNTGL